MKRTRFIARYGLLSAIILVLGAVERQFVLFPAFPGIRLGLGNAVVLYALAVNGVGAASALLAVKVLLGGLLYAGFTGMCYSLSGSVLSLAGMAILLNLAAVGFVGLSVSGAALHGIGQILASRLLIGSWAAAAMLPALLISGCVAGIVTGIASERVCLSVAGWDSAAKEHLISLSLIHNTQPRRK